MSDFVELLDSGIALAEVDNTADTDFVDIGDGGIIIISGSGFGEGGFGEGPFGGSTSLIISSSPTAWTDIETP